MPTNFRKGVKFNINEETSKDPAEIANVLDRKALIDFWGQKPFTDVTDQLRSLYVNTYGYETAKARSTAWTDLLKASGNRITTNDTKVRWKKIGHSVINHRIAKTSPGSNHGLRKEPFDIYLTTDSYVPTDRLRPVEAPLEHVVVMAGPFKMGAKVVKYTVRYVSDDPHAYLHPTFLIEGTRWCKAGSSTVSEKSSSYGSSMFDTGKSVLVYEVPLFKTGKKFEFTDEAIYHRFTVDAVDRVTGKPMEDMPNTVITAAELNFMAETEYEMEQDLLWGVSARGIPDPSTGLKMNIGAGVFDFLRDGHIYKFNENSASIDEFADFQDTVWFEDSAASVTDYWTGKPGLANADRMIRRSYNQINVITDYEEYVEKTGQVIPGGRDAWRLKRPMFTSYELPGHGIINFRYLPSLDVRDRGPKHPVTGKPLYGYHYLAMRYRGSDVNANIHLVNRVDALGRSTEFWSHQPGVVGPNGAINDKSGGKYQGTHSGRFSTLYHGNEYGLMIEDINDFCWFVPNIK